MGRCSPEDEEEGCLLNKKGWHTGSLRNIENVWKAEQKQLAEEKKLEGFRKQIQEERECQEFRLLQEQAGLVPFLFKEDLLSVSKFPKKC